MPGSCTAKHPRGYEIEFHEDTHKYISVINGEEISYTSGTQFIHQFFPPFDPDGSIAKRCAERDGISVAEVRAKWAAAGKEATTIGTRVHECCEDTILKRPLRNSPTTEKEKTLFNYVVDIGERLLQRLDILGVEKIVFSPSLIVTSIIDGAFIIAFAIEQEPFVCGSKESFPSRLFVWILFAFGGQTWKYRKGQGTCGRCFNGGGAFRNARLPYNSADCVMGIGAAAIALFVSRFAGMSALRNFSCLSGSWTFGASHDFTVRLGRAPVAFLSCQSDVWKAHGRVERL